MADADNNGSGIGGGIDNNDGETFISVNSTVLENVGGGISNDGDFTLANSIIASSEGADFSGDQPSIFGTNIVADNTLSPVLPGIEAVDPATLLFSELQDNGGPTQTLLPLEGNPVIDFGDNAALSEAMLGVDLNSDGDIEDSLLADQRIFDRIFNGTVDIGAVEAGASEFVAPPNAPPIFTSTATVSAAENATEVLTLTADDTEGDDLSFSIVGGADQAAFAVDTLTGVLAFQAAPDFEAPVDADGDNVFEVEVSVTDGINDPVAQALTVTVTDDPADNPGVPVNLNVDGVGDIVPSVDVLNIFRVLAGAPQAVVVPDGVSQQAVADAVNAFSELGLDVDGSGDVVASVDVLNIFRVLAGAPQAVVVPAGVSQQDVVDAVNGLAA